jgi:hypothetical protein
MLRCALVLALVSLLAYPAQAQHPQTRQGFWISGGAGYGSLDVACDGCESDRESGVTALLALGGSPSQNFLIGGEVEGWSKEVDGVDIVFGHVSGVAYWYPQATGGFFVKGGVGLGTLSVDAGPLGDDSDTGLALHTGAGYDIRLGRNFSLTPTAGVFWASLDPGDSNTLYIGLNATGH